MKALFRKLQAEEIEVRLGSVDKYGFSLVLYKDARVDRKILNETFGPFGWRSSYRKEEGMIFCRVEIFSELHDDWIWKEETGSAGNFEPEKTLASDALKRAGFAWGLGEELYTAPRIHLKAQTEYNGKRYSLANGRDAYGWSVKRINYDDKGICALELTKDDKVAFTWERDPYQETMSDPITADQAELLEQSIPPELLDDILHTMGVRRTMELTGAQYAEVVKKANEQL